MSPANADAEQHKLAIEQALARLRNGELVVVPTETVYGLAADAENPEAVAGIFVLKGRPSSRPLIVHIADATQLEAWAVDIPEYASKLAQAFWPGPLSLVLRRSARVPDAVTGGQDTVALRVPAHPLTLRLLQAFGGGIAAPSANRYGRISPTLPDHVRVQFGEETPYLLDGGPCSGGIESTIVGCLQAEPVVLRPGLISASQISEVTGLAVVEQTEPSVGAQGTLRTAGQDISHYAPSTPTILVPHDDHSSWPDLADKRIGFLGFHAPVRSVDMKVELDIRLPLDPHDAAQTLYANMHLLDDAQLDILVFEAPPNDSSWRGLQDRLKRSAAPRD